MRSAKTIYKLKCDLAHKNALWDYLTFACIEFSSPESCGLDCVCILFSAGDLEELIDSYKKCTCVCTEFPVCYPRVLGRTMSHYWECLSPLALKMGWSQSSHLPSFFPFNPLKLSLTCQSWKLIIRKHGGFSSSTLEGCVAGVIYRPCITDEFVRSKVLLVTSTEADFQGSRF